MWQKSHNQFSPFFKLLRRYHFLITAILIIALFALEGVFLYRYFYQGLTESKILFTLKQQAALEELDIPTYAQLREFHDTKRKERPVNWDTLKNPFSSSSSSPSLPKQ